MSQEEFAHTSTMIILAPTSLSPASEWSATLEALSVAGNLSLFCIDEAHTIEQSGRFFRPDFTEAVVNMSRICALSPCPFPVIAQFAILLQSDIGKCTKLIHFMKPTVLHGSLARRGTKLLCVISGKAGSSIKSSAEEDLKEDRFSQQLWYTNSKAIARPWRQDRWMSQCSSRKSANKKRMSLP